MKIYDTALYTWKSFSIPHRCVRIRISSYLRASPSLSRRSSSSVISMFEHSISRRIKCPVTSFTRRMLILINRRGCFFSRYLNETVIQAEIVSYTILPTLSIISVIWKSVHDEAIDTRQSESSRRRWINCHSNQCYIRIGWFLVSRWYRQ